MRFKAAKSNLQRRRRVFIVFLHRVLHQPSTYEHACQFRILHFRWIVARRQYRFQSHAYVLVQGRNHPLGHLAGSYHVRGSGYKLGRGDRYVTFRRALRITVFQKKEEKREERKIDRKEYTHDSRHHVAHLFHTLRAAEEIGHVVRAHVKIPYLPDLHQLAVLQPEHRLQNVIATGAAQTGDSVTLNGEHGHALSLREVFHQLERSIVLVYQSAYVQLSNDHPNHVQFPRLHVLVHDQTVQTLLREPDLELILIDLVRLLPGHPAHRDRRCIRVQALRHVTVRLRLAKMAGQRVETFRLAHQFRRDVQPDAYVATFLRDRGRVHLDVERVFGPVYPRGFEGDTSG